MWPLYEVLWMARCVGTVEAPFVVDLCSLIQHCALESLKEALCMSVWPFSHGHRCIFIIFCIFCYLLVFLFCLFVLPLPCFYTCSFAGSDSQKPVGELCVCVCVPVCA